MKTERGRIYQIKMKRDVLLTNSRSQNRLVSEQKNKTKVNI